MLVPLVTVEIEASVFGTKTRTVFREFATVKQAFRELEFSAGFRAGDTSCLLAAPDKGRTYAVIEVLGREMTLGTIGYFQGAVADCQAADGRCFIVCMHQLGQSVVKTR